MAQNRQRKKVILLGSGGREFHNFNVCFRDNPDFEVVSFSAVQIPNNENRVYPPELSGPLYSRGIPIFPEKFLPAFIEKLGAEEVVFAYSDIPHIDVMHKASQILARGCDFKLLAPHKTMLKAKVPVISICSVRTGCGKSKLTLQIAKILQGRGKKVVIVRHPSVYFGLRDQIMQRFAKLDDLEGAACAAEDMGELEQLVGEGFVVYSGIDYQKILASAQKEADMILWDGGNNDFPFFKPNFHIVICDPFRAGHEVLYHPGEANLRMANLVVINKSKAAMEESAMGVLHNVKVLNPDAKILFLDNKVMVSQPESIKNRTVLVVEDGSFMAQNRMSFGEAYLAAKQLGARKILEPKNWASPGFKKIFADHPYLKNVLPVFGYGKKQLKELESTINSSPCEAVLSALPVNLGKAIKVNKPVIGVDYEENSAKAPLTKILTEAGMIK